MTQNNTIPSVLRATGRTIPDLTKREHVCEYQSSVVAQSGAPTRTPKDYAIEHGGYLADRAQQYLDAKNRYDTAVAGYADEGEVPNSDELSDCHQALRSAIFEFRKRRERAEAVAQPGAPAEKWDKPCSACGDGDIEMKYHDHKGDIKMNGTKRKFTIVLEVIDEEGPDESNKAASDALSAYIKDALLDLAFDVLDIKVSCE